MTGMEFRKLALSFPEAVESEHMGHPDFRVGGKIFATLGPDEDWGMAKLKPEQQESYMSAAPAIFKPASGAWGRGGSTIVHLAAAKKPMVRKALMEAWLNTAPKKLAQNYDAK
jgi:hypothetical protein